jgi:hypothetical protein
MITKLDNGLELIKKADGYYCIITLPMYPPDKTFLYTNDKKVATKKAIALFQDMKSHK